VSGQLIHFCSDLLMYFCSDLLMYFCSGVDYRKDVSHRDPLPDQAPAPWGAVWGDAQQCQVNAGAGGGSSDGFRSS
jgi:hypothetical protein